MSARRDAERAPGALALRTIGSAARFFLTRHCQRTRLGPYLVITAEVRRSAYETRVCWGEEGPAVESFGTALSLEREQAEAAHRRFCARVERLLGPACARAGARRPPAA